MLDAGIYLFHMPAFFFLSGYVFYGANRPWGSFLKRLTLRMALPYCVWSVVLVSLKLLARGHVVHPITPLTYLDIVYSPVSPFWFLYSLMIVQLIARIILRNCGESILLMSGFIAFCGHVIFPGGGEVVRGVLGFLLFFGLGRFVHAKGLISRPTCWSMLYGLASFGVMEWLCLWGGLRYARSIRSLAAIPLVLALAWVFSGIGNTYMIRSRPLQCVGRKTLQVYCIHPLILGVCLIIFSSHHFVNLPTYLAVTTIVGVVGPLLLFAAMERLRIAHYTGLF